MIEEGHRKINLASKKYYVYMIQSEKDGSIYTGIAINPEERLKKHNNNTGAKYTRHRGPFVMIWNTECPNRSAASKLEYSIKKLSHNEKRELAIKNPCY